MELANDLAKHVVNAEFGDIPEDAVEGTKRIILDEFATAIAGSSTDGATQVVAEVLDWSGKPESTLWGYGDKVPAVNAAFANSVMAHAWDFDDTHMPSICHTGVVTVPPAFAIAEKLGKLSGKDLITAVNIGIDVQVRLSMAANTAFGQGWHPTAVFGCFGTAATVGSLMKLNEEQMINAFGITYAQTSGNLQCIQDGVLTKRLQPGFAVKAGFNGVMLALRGVTGVRNVFEGEYGFYNLYTRGEYNRDKVTSGLGKEFETGNLTIKPHPGCILAQPFENEAISLAVKNDIKPEEVESIVIYCGTASYTIPGAPVKKHPTSIVDAQFSIYYKLANAIVRRRSSAREYTLEAIQNPEVLALAKKVEIKLDTQYDTELYTESGGRLEIRTKRDNKVFKTDIGPHIGTPENPMSWEDLIKKLEDCAVSCIKPISKMNLDTLSETVKRLESLENVNQLISLLVGKKKLSRCMG